MHKYNKLNTNVFITGTDTEVGKTYIACKILQYWKNNGYKTLALKPVSSGTVKIENNYVNEDADLLHKSATLSIPVDMINPFSFPQFIAPHIAAKINNKKLTVDNLYKSIEKQLQLQYDFCLIEGAGGWSVPLNETETLAHFAKKLNFPVLMVVNIKLGCINHALLTYESMKSMGVPILGWVANCKENMEPMIQQENIKIINNYIKEDLFFF